MKAVQVSEAEIEYLRRAIAQLDQDLLALLAKAEEVPEPKPDHYEWPAEGEI